MNRVAMTVRSVWRQLGLPLLAKELIEQSARKRTYVIRFLYASVLYGTTLWVFAQQLGSWNASGLAILGQGRTLYTSLAWLEFLGIYLFLPAMTCGVLTSEKERDTLGLLLLTKLGPWTIIFEKLFSRIVPMATFVLLSMPLLAVAYSLGGVETVDIAKLMWLLAATAFQVGSFAVLCSAWSRTTASAFLSVYLLGPIAILLSGICFQFVIPWWLDLTMSQMISPDAYAWIFRPVHFRPTLLYLSFGPWILNGGELFEHDPTFMATRMPQTFLDCVALSLPMLAMSLASLGLARVILWRRAFIQPRNLLLKVFQSLDAYFYRINQNKLTRGIVLIKERVTLPHIEPIKWRETAKRSLGTTRYLIRILIAIEFPVLVIVLFPVSDQQINSPMAPTFIAAWIVWIVAALVLVIQSTGLIGIERSRQTLDVLLTMPMESEEIVRQKFAGVWRMIRMLWVPFFTVYFFQVWWRALIQFSHFADDPVVIIARGLLTVGLYLPIIAWFGFQQGLRRRTQTQAILVTMSVITAVCAVPAAIGRYYELGTQHGMGYQDHSSLADIKWLSPAYVLVHQITDGREFVMMALHFAVASLVYMILRGRAYKVFAHFVGRNDGVLEDPIELTDTETVSALSHDDRMERLRRGRVVSNMHCDSADTTIRKEEF